MVVGFWSSASKQIGQELSRPVLRWRALCGKEGILVKIGRLEDVGRDELFHRLWLKILGWDLRKSALSLRELDRRNRRLSAPVVSGSGPIVSLTTHGKRIETVFMTLESIARGSLLPQRLILWLDDAESFRTRPDSLRRLEDRGLEVRQATRYGPHTKYYPYLQSSEVLTAPLVTADDDTLYPAGWLHGLNQNFLRRPDLISCCRAHTVLLEGPGFAPYVTWPRCRSTQPSALNFATGVSGVIYPPDFQKQVKAAGTAFIDLCPKADDVWLHMQALRGGFQIRQIKRWEQTFPTLPGTQGTGLIQGNVHGSQNDVQIRKTYTASDILSLQQAAFYADYQ